MLPSWIKSRNDSPRFVYFLAMEMTSRKFASTISVFAWSAFVENSRNESNVLRKSPAGIRTNSSSARIFCFSASTRCACALDSRCDSASASARRLYCSLSWMFSATSAISSMTFCLKQNPTNAPRSFWSARLNAAMRAGGWLWRGRPAIRCICGQRPDPFFGHAPTSRCSVRRCASRLSTFFSRTTRSNRSRGGSASSFSASAMCSLPAKPRL